jgi:hypothetical protein
MRQNSFGKLWPVSALTLGGGGIGMVWGETTFDECVATVHAAIAAGINLIDLAPSYGDGKAEQVVGEAFGGHLLALGPIPSSCGSPLLRPAIHPSKKSNPACGSRSKGAWDASDCRGSICFFSIRMWCPTRTTWRAGPRPPASGPGPGSWHTGPSRAWSGSLSVPNYRSRQLKGDAAILSRMTMEPPG